MFRRTSALIVILLILAAAIPSSMLGAGGVLYVDGRTGHDSNDGRTPQSAFKTIAKAASSLPAGSSAAGWSVVVQGYSDYIYRERPIPPGWDRRGASGAPITFTAAGYVAGDDTAYVKPIISGAAVAPASGRVWTPTSKPGIWRTPWAATPFGYGTYSGSLRGALFQDDTTWLWEQSSITALASRATAGKGGFWYDRAADQLYVSPRGTPGTSAQHPNNHKIEVVLRNAFLFMGTQGVAHVTVQGFDVRHAANGIAFIKGADYGTIRDNVLMGNLLMGIQTSGGQTSAGPNPATGHVVERNVGSYNTLQFIKIDEGTQSSTFCSNTARRNGLQGIKVQGPPGGTAYTGTTSRITICRNRLELNNYNPTGSAYNNASGLTIANGAQYVTVDRNVIAGNDVGILVTQESSGRRAMNGLALTNNEVYNNRRFGLYLFDGYKSSTGGSGTLSSRYDTYWGNGIGIMAGRGTSHKSISHATIHYNKSDGIRIGEAGQRKATVSVSSSLITANRGYGMWLVSGNAASLKYSGVTANKLGVSKGPVAKTAVNQKAAGYLATTPGLPDYLRISAQSYQYTAGASGTPIGARY